MALGLGDEPYGDDARLDDERTVEWRSRSTDQLSRDDGPLRVDIAAMKREARGTRGAAGNDEGADVDRAAPDHERKVRAICGHERRDRARCQHMVGDDDGRGIHPLFPVNDRRRRAGELDGVHERPSQLLRGIVGHQQRQLGRCRIGRESAADAPNEIGARAVGGAECRGDGSEGRFGDAVLELAQQALLLGGGVVDDRDGIEPELQCRRRAPQRRMGGIETEHAPIIARGSAVVRSFHS